MMHPARAGLVLSRQSIRLLILGSIVAAAGVAGCAEQAVTDPVDDVGRVRPRRTEYVCVSSDSTGQIVQPLSSEGTCQPGFEMMPWT